MEKLEMKYGEFEIVIHNAYGLDDDCAYWDKIFFLTIDETPYIMLAVGSLSGYIENYQSLKKVDFNYLDKRKMISVDDFYRYEITHDCFNKADFLELFDFMLLHKATEVSYDGNYIIVA